MSDHLARAPRGVRLVVATLITVSFAAIVIWRVGADGRSLGFAFGINWLLMAWAIVTEAGTPYLRCAAIAPGAILLMNACWLLTSCTGFGAGDGWCLR